MSDTSAAIRIDINAADAETGARRVNAALDSIIRRQGSAGAANDNAADSIRRLGSSMSGTATQGSTLSRVLGTLENSVGGLAGRFGGLASAVGAVSFGGLAAGAVALTGVFVAAGKEAAGYQDVLAKISTNVDTTKFSMDALSAGILKQSQAFGQSPAAQAEAAYDIISAGADSAAAAIDILTASNKLAVGGITTVGVAADGLTSIINSYGSANITAAQASDAMFISARDGKTTIDQLSSTLGTVTPLAASVGVSFDEVAGAIGVLTKGGIKTAESVTGLKSILSSVAKPSSEAAKAAKSIGLEFNVAALRAKGLRGFLNDVAVATGGSAAKMSVLFGNVEALVPVLALTGKGAADFTATMKSMGDKAGTTQAAVQKMLDGSPSVQVARVIAAFQVELVKLGTTIAQAVTPALKFLADNLDNAVRIAKVLGATFLVFKTLSIASTLLQSASAFQAVGAAASGLNAIIKGATAAQALFNAVVLANPFVAAAAAITAIVGLLYSFRDSITLGGGSLTTLGDLGRAVFESIVPLVKAAGDTIKSVFGSVGSFLSNAFSGVTPLLAEAFGSLTPIFQSVFGDLNLSFEGVLIGAARVADGMVGLFRGSFLAVGAIWNDLPALLGPNLMAIVNFGKAITTDFAKNAAWVVNGIVSVAQSLASLVVAALNDASKTFTAWGNSAIAVINGIIGGANKLGAAVKPLAQMKAPQITAPKVQTPFQKAGQDAKSAFLSGFGHDAENSMAKLIGKATVIGAKRRAAAKGGASNDNGGGSGNTTTPNDSAFDKPEKDKKSKAEQEAERRAKQEKEFWATLQGEAETAKLLPMAAEDYKKELELQKILGRDLTKSEKERVDTLMDEARTSKFVTAASDSHNKAVRQNAQDQSSFAAKLLGQTQEQSDVEQAMFTFKNSALDAGVNLMSQAYKLAEAQARLDAQGAAAIKKKNEQLATAVDLAGQYSTAYQKYADDKKLTDNKSALETAYNGGNNTIGFTKQVHDQIIEGMGKAITDKAAQLEDQFGERISNLGEQISGKWGDAISGIGKLISSMAKAAQGDFSGLGVAGSLINLLGTKKDGTGTDLKTNATKSTTEMLNGVLKGDTYTAPLKSLSSGFDSFKGDLKGLFGKGGDFTKSLGSVLGKAGAGAAIGDAVNGLAGAIGVKLNKTGSSLGGAVGGLALGPLGAIGGSIIGGLLGNLFSKPKESSTGFATDAKGNVSVGNVTGSNAALKTATSGAAGEVISGLQSIASSIGGQLTGAPNLQVGTFNGKWRVNDSATSKSLNYNNFNDSSLHNFDDDEAAAVSYAIKKALTQGVITGLSDLAQKALKALDGDAAVSFIQQWSSVMSDFKSMTDPMGAAVQAIIDPLKGLRETMITVGASTEDLTKLDQYRAAKLDEVLKQQTQSFTDILANLNGDAGGVTALSQLTSELSDFDKFKSDIASGKQVNQDDYSSLVQKIIGNAGDVYGTNNSQYQDIVSLLKGSTTDALANATKAFNADAGNTTPSATSGDISAQTNAITANQSIQTDYLAQIAAGINNLGSSGSSVTKYGSVNGSTVAAY